MKPQQLVFGHSLLSIHYLIHNCDKRHIADYNILSPENLLETSREPCPSRFQLWTRLRSMKESWPLQSSGKSNLAESFGREEQPWGHPAFSKILSPSRVGVGEACLPY